MKSLCKFLTVVLLMSVFSLTFAQNNGNNIDKYNMPVLPNIYNLFSGGPSSPTSTIKTDFNLTLRDGVLMDASKFYPSEPNIYLPNGYPIVVMVHGYGDRKETLENFATSQANFGYVVYTYSVRGQGNSGGLSNLISRTEAQDLIELVNYIKNDIANTGGDSSKVLIMGGSQGGTLPYMAASMGMKVKCIISALTSPEFASSWIENGCVKMSMLWTVEYTSDTARYTPTVDRMSDWIYSNQNAAWDSLAYYVPKDRDFKNIIGNNTTPLLIENSWQDMFFNASGSISTIPFVTSPARYYFGAVMGHGGDTSPTEDAWHMNFFNEWFFYWLFGIENNILTRAKYNYAYTSFPEVNNQWSFVHDSSTVWPPQGVTNTKLFFHPLGKLKKTSYMFPFLFGILPNIVLNNYSMKDIVADEFKGTRFNNNFRKDTLVFYSDPLTNGAKMIGTPQINLDYFSTSNVCQFNFQIYEVSATGQSKFITSVNYTDRKCNILSRKDKLINGSSHAHIFQPGSKIKIILTNLDTRSNYPFLGSNPYVLPVMKFGLHGIFFSDKSFISLPLIGTPGFAVKETEDLAPAKFELSQNFPNPFNPATTINFNLPANYAGMVSLKIYDITGREIETLINNQMSGGRYSVSWNASKYSSGIYFYKLIAGTYTDVKRMSLVK